jgi:hypothetical protein
MLGVVIAENLQKRRVNLVAYFQANIRFHHSKSVWIDFYYHLVGFLWQTIFVSIIIVKSSGWKVIPFKLIACMSH